MQVYQQENPSSDIGFGLLHKLSKISSHFEKINALRPQEKAMQVTDDPFLLSLVEKLGTCFAQPEEVIMKQGEMTMICTSYLKDTESSTFEMTK